MEKLIGHEKQWRYFLDVLRNGSLGHAYIFSGPQMVGKKSFARNLYLTINDQEAIEERDPYFMGISSYGEAKNVNSISITTIRSIRKFFSLKPAPGYTKCVIVDDAHKLTDEASNALLKILEEPPPSGMLILVTHLPGFMPATIRSRCEQVRFSSLPDKLISNMPEVKQFSGSKANFILKLANGRPGCVLRLLEGDKFKDAENSIEDLRKLLKQGIVERFQYAQRLSEGENLTETVDWWLDWVSASLKESHQNAPILRQLLALQSLIDQPQFNSRLALENFFLKV